MRNSCSIYITTARGILETNEGCCGKLTTTLMRNIIFKRFARAHKLNARNLRQKIIRCGVCTWRMGWWEVDPYQK